MTPAQQAAVEINKFIDEVGCAGDEEIASIIDKHMGLKWVEGPPKTKGDYLLEALLESEKGMSMFANVEQSWLGQWVDNVSVLNNDVLLTARHGVLHKSRVKRHCAITQPSN